MTSDEQFRTSMKLSVKNPDLAVNQHWLARLLIGIWSLQIPAFAVLVPESLVGRAIHVTGWQGELSAYVLMGLAGLAVVDSLSSDAARGPVTGHLRKWRHLGFSALAGTLIISAAGFAVATHSLSMVFVFGMPASFCVMVTLADFHARIREISR